MKSKQYVVSIIVAFYKSEPFIKKCINSIINQTYDNLEIILVDDGSPDNCGKICDEYAKQDKRIKVIHKKNGGACEARNAGLNIATGDFVSIIDGDDWLSPDYVDYLLKIAIDYDCDLVMTDNIFTSRDQKQIKNDKISVITNEEAAIMIIYPYIPIGPWNKLYRLKLLKDHNITFCVPWSGEGLHFSVTAAQNANKVGLGHRKIYNYRLNNVESGLTKYNLIMGTNALDNIIRIKSEFIIKSQRLINAANWHIWKNNAFVIKLIIATNSKKSEKKLLNKCKRYLKSNMIKVAVKSEIGLKNKLKIVLISLFPIFYSKISLRRERINLLKDKMN